MIKLHQKNSKNIVLTPSSFYEFKEYEEKKIQLKNIQGHEIYVQNHIWPLFFWALLLMIILKISSWCYVFEYLTQQKRSPWIFFFKIHFATTFRCLTQK